MKLLPGARFDDGVLDLIEWARRLPPGRAFRHPAQALQRRPCPSSQGDGRPAAPPSAAPRAFRDPGSASRRRDGGPPAARGHRSATGLPGRDRSKEPPDERRVQKGAGRPSSCSARCCWSLATSAVLVGLASPAWAESTKTRTTARQGARHGQCGRGGRPSSSNQVRVVVPDHEPRHRLPVLPQRILGRPLPAGPGQEGQWLPASRASPEAASALSSSSASSLPPAVVYPSACRRARWCSSCAARAAGLRVRPRRQRRALLMDMTNRMVADVVNDINDYDSLGLD